MDLLLRKGIRQCILLFAILCLSFFRLTGQVPDLHFEHITSNDGLPNDDINDILQDQRGFMWFCTWDGLIRYDGYRFLAYKPDIRDQGSISSKLVYCIVEDPAGGLWVGTMHGLNYYDRETGSFRRFLSQPGHRQSLLSDWIIDLAFDRDGNLWVACDKGLTRVVLDSQRNPLSFHHFTHQPDDPRSLPDNQVMSLIVDHANQVWAGTLAGLVRIDQEGRVLRLGDPDKTFDEESPSVTAVYEDIHRNIWVGTQGGRIYQWDRSTGAIRRQNDFGLQQPRSNKYVSDFCEDSKGNFWIGIFGAGIFMQAEGGPFQMVRHHSEARSGLGSRAVKVLYPDRSGVLWIGLEGAGLDKLDLYRKPFRLYQHQSDDPASLSSNTVMSFAEDPLGRVWIGTKEGVNVFYPDQNRFVHYKNQRGVNNPLITDKIWSLCADTVAGIMWIGGHYGLTRVDLKERSPSGANRWAEGDLSTRFRHILLTDPKLDAEKHQVRSIYRDRAGLLWVGTYHGLYVLQVEGDTVRVLRHYLHDPADPGSLSDDIIIMIMQDRGGDMWIGTRDGGLNRLIGDVHNGRTHFVRHMVKAEDYNSLSGNEVASMYEDSEGNLWVGTADGGLNKLERSVDPETQQETIIFSHFDEQDGLLGDAIFGILEDDARNLWLSTNQGLFKLDRKLPHGQRFQQFTMAHGLQGNMFFTGAYHKSRYGNMYFGGLKGFNVFHPDCIRENPYLPEVVITDLIIFNQPAAAGEGKDRGYSLPELDSETGEIELSYKINNFSLEFSALHYASPENNKFAYRLEGFDAEWIYTDASRRYVSYSNLKPGTYAFRVKASNADNVWNERFTQLVIHAGTPPWRTWWAIGLYGLFLLSFLFAFRYYTLNKSRLENNLEIQRREYEKSEELNRAKLHFFTQISHEFRTPLTLIIGPVQELVSKAKQMGKKEMKRHLKVIEFNKRHLLRLIDQLLYFSQAEYGHLQFQVQPGDLVAFLRQVTDSFRFRAKKQGIQLHLDTLHTQLEVALDWDKMEKILNNLIFNALKFTPEKGEIGVKLRLESRGVPAGKTSVPVDMIIEVWDTGIGIPADKLTLIFDSFYQVATHDTHVGFGIGLALIKKLTELHEGNIEVKSREGRGTTFTIRLPYDRWRLPVEAGGAAVIAGLNSFSVFNSEDEKLMQATEAVAEEPSHGAYSAADARPLLLIADDNADIRAYLSGNLRSNYQIMIAENGLDAWAKALKYMPNLVISDIMMPVMDGMQLCSLLKSDERTNHIPIILLTAKSSIRHQIEGLKAGADAYLPKPFHPEHLQVRVEKLIELRTTIKEKYANGRYEAPDEQKDLTEDEKFLEKLTEIIEKHLSDTGLTVSHLERELAMSHMQLYRKLKALTGQSANEFIRSVRLNHAAKLLKSSQLNVNEVAFQVGFNSPSYFIKCFREEYGLLPKAYGQEHKKVLVESRESSGK